MTLTEREIDKLEDLIIGKEIEIQASLDRCYKFGQTTKEVYDFYDKEIKFWSAIYEKLQIEKSLSNE